VERVGCGEGWLWSAAASFWLLLLLLLLLPVLVALVLLPKGATSKIGATHTGSCNSRFLKVSYNSMFLQVISTRGGEKRATTFSCTCATASCTSASLLLIPRDNHFTNDVCVRVCTCVALLVAPVKPALASAS